MENMAWDKAFQLIQMGVKPEMGKEQEWKGRIKSKRRYDTLESTGYRSCSSEEAEWRAFLSKVVYNRQRGSGPCRESYYLSSANRTSSWGVWRCWARPAEQVTSDTLGDTLSGHSLEDFRYGADAEQLTCTLLAEDASAEPIMWVFHCKPAESLTTHRNKDSFGVT